MNLLLGHLQQPHTCYNVTEYHQSEECICCYRHGPRHCHWEIENSLHWVLDVAFREDDSRVRQGIRTKTWRSCVIWRLICLNRRRQLKVASKPRDFKRLGMKIILLRCCQVSMRLPHIPDYDISHFKRQVIYLLSQNASATVQLASRSVTRNFQIVCSII